MFTKTMDPDANQHAEIVGQIANHQAALRAYIISLMPGVDGVSDVLQETNLVLWEKRATFRPGTNFMAWACAIARYEVKSHRRKMLRSGITMFDEDLAGQLAEHCQAAPDEMNERLHALDRCLGRLEEKDRQLIEHRYFSAATLDEFAARSGRPVDSLRVTLFRVRAALRNCINDQLAVSRSRA